MKRFFKCLLALGAIFAVRAAWMHLNAHPQTAVSSKGRRVYISQNGTKYHRRTCRFATDEMIAVGLNQVLDSHQPCSLCRPG